jgi:hypothetical protein
MATIRGEWRGGEIERREGARGIDSRVGMHARGVWP